MVTYAIMPQKVGEVSELLRIIPKKTPTIQNRGEINLKLENTTEFLYKKVSQRVSKRTQESGYKYLQIFPTDPKQISWIINNRRGKNNPYLICDAVFGYKEGMWGLIPQLNFKNEQEVLWGSEAEIKEYLPQLYYTIMEDFFTEDRFDFVDEAFLEYVPYAFYRTLSELLFSGKSPALYYGVSEDNVFENLYPAKEEACSFFYWNHEDDIFTAFMKFSNETTSFKKINKVFDDKFIQKLLIPILKQAAQDGRSLGHRVRNLILSDISEAPSLLKGENQNEKYYRELINASTEYILRLKEIQSAAYTGNGRKDHK